MTTADNIRKLQGQIALIRALERSSGGMHLVSGNGDISLELTPREVEVHIGRILQERKSSAGIELANQPKEKTPILVSARL